MAFGKLLFIYRNIAYKKDDEKGYTTKTTKNTKNKALSQDLLIGRLYKNGIGLTKSSLSKYERDILKNQKGLWGNSKEDTTISNAVEQMFWDEYKESYMKNQAAFVKALNDAVIKGANTQAQGDKMIFSETTKNFLLQIINQNEFNNIINRLVFHAKEKDFSIYETDEEYIASSNYQKENRTTEKIKFLPGNTYTLPEFNYLDFIGRKKEIADLNVMVDSISGQILPKAPIIIYGEEGIGKTALAIHFARQYTDRKNSKAYYLSFERSMYETIVGTFAPLLSSIRKDYFHSPANKPADWKLFSDVIHALSSATNFQDILIIDNIDYKPQKESRNSDDIKPKSFWELCCSFPKGISGDTQALADFDLFEELSNIPAQLILITNSTPEKGNEHYIRLEAMPSADIEATAVSIWNKFKDDHRNLTKQQLISAINRFSVLVNNNTLAVTLFAHTACYHSNTPNLHNWINSLCALYKDTYSIYKFLFEHSALNVCAKQFLTIISYSYRIRFTAVVRACKNAIGDFDEYLKHFVKSGFMYYDCSQMAIYFHPYMQYFFDRYADEIHDDDSDAANYVSWFDVCDDKGLFLLLSNKINNNIADQLTPSQIKQIGSNDKLEVAEDVLGLENLADDLRKIIPRILEN